MVVEAQRSRKQSCDLHSDQSTGRRLRRAVRPVAARHAAAAYLLGLPSKEDSMHKLAIPQSVVDRVIARHGREHVHDDLDPKQDRAGRGRHAERLHAAGRGAFALSDGGEDRAQHQPAGARGARYRRHRGLDQDHLHRRDASELVDALSHARTKAQRQARRGAHRKQQGPRAVAGARRAEPRI